MKTQPAAADEQRYAVLDIETAPNPRPLSAVPAGSAERSSHSHVVTAVALLTAVRGDDADWTVDRLQSWHRPSDEHDVLRALQCALATELGRGATLVTFNGVRHDVPTIRRRAAYHRMFGLRAWDLLVTVPHRDLMTDGISGPQAQWASLAQTCAGLGIPTDHAFAAAAKATTDVARRKCETDVCATFVLLLYTLAMETGEPLDLKKGWKALSACIARDAALRPHLVQFAHAAEDQCI